MASNETSSESDDCKQGEKTDALDLLESVNSCDDIKSSNSGCVTPIGGANSMCRTTGAVQKTSSSSSISSQQTSRSDTPEITSKISAHSSSDVISPSAPAPPPPPPTPNVIAGSNIAQEPSYTLSPHPTIAGGSSSPKASFAAWQACHTFAQQPGNSECFKPLQSSPSVNPAAIVQPNDSSLSTSKFYYNIDVDNQDSQQPAFAALTGAYHHERYNNSTSEASSLSSAMSKVSVSEYSKKSSSTLGTASAGGDSPRSPSPAVSGAAASRSIASGGGVVDAAASFAAGALGRLPGSASHSSMLHSSACSCANSSSSNGVAHVCCHSGRGSSAPGSAARTATTGDRQNNMPNGDHSAALDAMQKRHPSAQHNAKAGPMYNWQATLTTVKERFAFLFNNEILSDVQFVVGRGDEEQNVPAHKFVLAVGSAVFDAMFNGRLASQQQVIHLPDVEPQAFLALLSFLYSDEVQIGPETVMTVLYTAKKYAVPALERRCVEFLQNHLSPDNAFMLLTQARLFDEPQLAGLCLKTIDKSTAEAIVAEGFTDIDHDTLTQVLQRDTLRIKELNLFQAVCRWAEAECGRQGIGGTGRQQRSVLGDALKLIRFPLMTVEEFAQGPAQSNILTDAEVVQLFLYYSVNPKPSVDFIDVPRCCMTGKEQTVGRFLNIESRWGYSGTPDRIRFIVDRRIFVVGFGMYGSIHGPSEYEVTVQLIHTLTGKVCGSNETVFTSDGTVNTFRVMFPDPIEILPSTNYTAYATLKGPDSHYGTKGMRKVVVECPSGDRVCFQFSYAAGNNNGTSVEDGQLPEIIFYT